MSKKAKAMRVQDGPHLKLVESNQYAQPFSLRRKIRELGFAKCLFIVVGLSLPLLMTMYFNDPFTVVKWLWLYVMGSALLIRSVFSSKPLTLPNFSRFAWGSIFALGIVWGINYFIQDVNPIQAPTLERGLFAIIAVFAFQCFTDEENPGLFSLPVVLSSIPFLIWAAQQYSECQTGVIRPDVDQSCFSGAFGNSNMSAEFLAIAFVCQADVVARSRYKWLRYMTAFLFTPTFMCIFLYQSRSVIIGTSVSFLLMLCLRNYISRWILIVSAVAAAAGVYGVSRLQAQEFAVADKSHSTMTRGYLYLDTLDTIKANPLGLGLSMYEFGVQPYRFVGRSPVQEHEVFKTPHSEPLRFAAQDGLQFLAVQLVIVFAALAYWIRNRKKVARLDNIFLVVFCLAMAPEIIFQFALENAYPFYAIAVAIGYGVSCLYRSPESRFDFRLHWLAKAALALVITAFSADMIVARYIEANYAKDSVVSYIGCQMEPLNWRMCFNSARFDIEAGRNELALQHLRAELIKRPYNFAALNLWSLVQFKTGRIGLGCQALNFYDSMFSGLDRQHNFYFATCPATPSYGKSNFIPEYEKFLKDNVFK